MSVTDKSLEERLDRFDETLHALGKRVEHLSTRLSALESAAPLPKQTKGAAPELHEMGMGGPADEAIWSWVGKSSLLPRVAAICFVLVFALMLRTLTDSGMLEKHIGTLLGMGYAACLMGFGWWLLARRSRLAPVFPMCGALLMFVIVLETHARFASISAPAAYALLFFTLLVLNVIGRRYQLASLCSLGIVGASCVAIAIDFPRPFFPYLIVLLLAANIAAHLAAAKLPRCEWTRWFLLVITFLVWMLWAFKLKFPLERQESMAPVLALHWYFPLLLLFAVFYFTVPVRRIFKNAPLRLFDYVLAIFTVLFVYTAAWLVAVPWFGHGYWLGLIGVAMAIVHYGVAYQVFRRGVAAAMSICIYTFAGSCLLVMAVPLAVGSVLLALPVWAAVALVLARMSGACEIGGVRLTSYMLPAVACGLGILSGSFSVQTPMPLAGMIVAGALALTSAIQYRWCRSNPLSCSAGFFSIFDPHDRSGILLLLATLISGFCMLQLGSQFILAKVAGDVSNALIGAQSVFINIGAIILMLYGVSRKNKEVLGTAVVVALIGAFKSFAYDLFEAHGVPLLLSVFSFGAVAAIGSVVLGRWQQMRKEAGG